MTKEKKMENNESEFIRHEPCNSCGSKDNLARYSDGHAYCFGCNYYEPSTDTPEFFNTREASDMVQGEHKSLNKRKIFKRIVRSCYR